MATVAEQLTSLAETKTAIKDAIVAKGVSVADTDTFRSYATKIGEISGGGAPATKYGVSIDNLLGDVNASGGLEGPTEPFSLDLTGVKELLGYGWAYKFYQNQAIISANLSTLVIVDSNGLSYTFYQCENLESVNLDSLAKITGYAGMASCFYKCKKLKKISFPALTSIADGAFGTWSLDYAFAESGVEEIHFRADMQATVEALTGYSEKFGATNAAIYFDL